MTIDTNIGEITSYLDGEFDCFLSGLPPQASNVVWELGTNIWIGARPPIDLDAFGRSDSEEIDSKMQMMDAFLWGRCLTDDEVSAFYTSMCPSEYDMIYYPDYAWQFGESPPRVCLATLCSIFSFRFFVSKYKYKKVQRIYKQKQLTLTIL